MNPVIKRELEKIRAPLPEIDDNTKVIHISKYQPPEEIVLDVNKRYLVGLPQYIVHEPPNYTLSTNWNKGVVPVSDCLKICVLQIFGRMVQVNAQGFDYITQQCKEDLYNSLWLPIDSITVIKEI